MPASEHELDDALAALRADPALRVVVEAARAWGVPPSRFMGREPAVALVPLDDGRPGWRMVRDPEWTSEDRDLAVALAALEADTCSGCGGSLTETTAVENDGRWVPGLPIRCHRCTAASIASKQVEESDHPTALHIALRDLQAPDQSPAD